MTFSRFDAADTRKLAERMTTEANQVQISNRQFALALIASMAGLAMLIWLLL